MSLYAKIRRMHFRGGDADQPDRAQDEPSETNGVPRSLKNCRILQTIRPRSRKSHVIRGCLQPKRIGNRRRGAEMLGVFSSTDTAVAMISVLVAFGLGYWT